METESKFSLYGEIDLANAGVVHAELTRVVASCGGDVALDCSELSFIDSSALTVLIRVRNEMLREGRRLRLVNLSGTPRTVIAMTGLAEVLGVA